MRPPRTKDTLLPICFRYDVGNCSSVVPTKRRHYLTSPTASRRRRFNFNIPRVFRGRASRMPPGLYAEYRWRENAYREIKEWKTYSREMKEIGRLWNEINISGACRNSRRISQFSS